MRLNLVQKNVAPVPPYECELVEYQPAATPFVLGALWLRSQKYWWLTPEDQKLGRRLMAQIGSEVLMPCGEAIVGRLEDIYRLFDATMNGRVYSYTGTGTPEDPYIIDPPIPVVPDKETWDFNSVRADLDESKQYLKNWTTGVPNFYVGDGRNPRQQYDDILAAIQAGGSFNDDDILAKLDLLLLAIGA